jgi:hypothetical protein
MFEQTSIESLYRQYGVKDLVPQVVLNKSTEYLAKRLKIEFISAVDDLDCFVGAALLVDNKYPIAIKHYRGNPKNIVTIYFPSTINDVELITQAIRDVLRGLRLDTSSIQWERKMGLPN